MSKMVLMFSLTGVCLVLTMLGNGGSCRPKEGPVMKDPVGSNQKLANGVWGGQHIRAEVTDKGVVIEFDCAHGSIDGPITLDGRGSFDVKGKFASEHGGPTRRNERDNSRAIRYVGRVSNKELTLTLSDLNTKEDLDSFTLTLGSEGRLMKCR
jgi:hypothetical protein